MSKRNSGNDRGAAAVEFAIVLPLLLLIVFGIVDFGLALYSKVTITQAAREGARLEALDQDNVADRTRNAATGLDPVDVIVDSECPGSTDAEVRVEYTFEYVTPVGAIAAMISGGDGFGDPILMSAKGVMPCET